MFFFCPLCTTEPIYNMSKQDKKIWDPGVEDED